MRPKRHISIYARLMPARESNAAGGKIPGWAGAGFALLAAAFAGSASAGTIVFSNGPGSYTFIAPATGTYEIDTAGASGSGSVESSGGSGAEADALFELTQNEGLTIVVGAGGANQGTLGGGGGGSFAYVTSVSTLLEAAGGGGGGTDSSINNGFGPANGGNASLVSTALAVSGGSVAGVNGSSGECCGTSGAPGAGGASYIDSSVADGFQGGGTLIAHSGKGQVTITQQTVDAPEPASLTLLATGVAFLGLRRRRRSSTPA